MHVKLVAEEENNVVRCRTEGDITQAVFKPDQEPLTEMFGGDIYGRKVLLDLGGSSFIDSFGVGWLLRCHKKFRESGGALVLYGISPLVARSFRVLKLDQVFKMAKDEDSARKVSLGGSA